MLPIDDNQHGPQHSPLFNQAIVTQGRAGLDQNALSSAAVRQAIPLDDKDWPLAQVARNQGLSLGLSVAACYSRAPTTSPIILSHNFQNNSVLHRPPQGAFLPEEGRARVMPLYVDPTPLDSWAISQLVLMTAQKDEIALVPRPIDGAYEYGLREGLIAPGQVVPLDLTPARGHTSEDLDLLRLAAKLPSSVRETLEGKAFVSAFSTPFIRERAKKLGLSPIQKGDSVFADDKRSLLRNAAEYGIATCPHVEVTDNFKFNCVPRYFSRYGAWLKLSQAMGGCGIVHLKPGFGEEELLQGLQVLRKDVIAGMVASKAFTKGSAARIWPEGARAPTHYGVTLEVDASMFGTKLLTGSSVLSIDESGRQVTSAYFQQMLTDQGEFLGSGLLDVTARFGPKVLSILQDQSARIAKLCAEKLNFAGVCGIDFIVLETKEGELEVRIIELNARPPISATSFILGSQKLKATAWRAPYLISRAPLVAMDQLEELLTINGKNLTRSDPDSGRITPLHFGTICTRKRETTKVVRPSHWCQVLVSAASDAETAALIEKVQAGGEVRFGRPEW